MRRAVVAMALLLGSPIYAQTSASFTLEEHTLNAGGTPNGGVTLTSAGFQITLAAIGGNAVATGLSSTSFQLDGGFVTG